MFEILRIFFFFFFIEDDLVWVGSFLLWKYNKILESFHVFGWYRFNFPLGVFLLLSLFPWKFADIAFLENSLFLASCLAPCIIALLSCWIIKAFLDGSSINELASVPTDTVTLIRPHSLSIFSFRSLRARSSNRLPAVDFDPSRRGWRIPSSWLFFNFSWFDKQAEKRTGYACRNTRTHLSGSADHEERNQSISSCGSRRRATCSFFTRRPRNVLSDPSIFLYADP